MTVRFYDKREAPYVTRNEPFLRFTSQDNGRHTGYLSREAMEAMDHPDRILLGWNNEDLHLLVIPVRNGDPRALAVNQSRNKESGQFSASGFLRRFRLEHLMDRRLSLVRSGDHYDPPAGSGMMVRVVEEEDEG